MSHRVNKIKKRIAKRRRLNGRMTEKPYEYIPQTPVDDVDENRHIYEPKPAIHPLWRKEIFIFKMLSSAVLVLLIAILYQSSSSRFDQVRSWVNDAMEKEFQFAAVSDWYESQFGKPLVLFPDPNQEPSVQQVIREDYALPVGAKITEGFSHDGRGIIIETEKDFAVKAGADGVVIFSGKKEDIGHTVIIQHSDRSESWYGKLNETSIKPHERVKGGQVIGTVSSNDNHGEYYFAIKQEDTFIDPIQVMNLD
ncbi:peptidoglycan DD-metalloendopeptidase family protein [Siminovitchia sediminis]|uniref:Peptidoglycan DD-metalloendopeptidase family protein n=1 Tax=Siminovitchia sediminis TaxID=1274353 RepID=A0ABW4KDF1_9BACI